MHRPGWVAAAGWLACLALTVGFVALAVSEDGPDTGTQTGFGVLIGLLGMAQPTVGALIAVRRPGNAVGWLLLGGALAFAVVYAGDRYARFGTGSLPGAAAAALAAGAGVLVGTALALVTVLVFPTGRLLSPRWRAVVCAAGAMVAAGVVAHGLAPGPLPEHPRLTNPAGVAGIDGVREAAGAALGALQIGVAGAALASVVVRYRRAGPTERIQLRWIGYAVGLLIAYVLAGDAVTALYPATAVGIDITGGLLFATLLPAAVGIAVLRHGLFDIDRLIRRTVVYGLLWAAITAAYAGAAAALGLAAAGAELPVGAAILLTIAATLVFDPARRRLQRVADRLVFGDRPDRYRLLAEFGAQLQATFDLAELAPRLAATIRDGLDVGWARVTLPDGASATAGTPRPGTVPGTVVALVHAGSTVGRIETGPVGDTDRELLDTLGGHAALALHNAGLAAELARRLDQIRTQADELAASRARIVHAQDAERRRIERNIHDGAQQQLVALLAELRRARTLLARDPDAADATLHRLQDETRRILGDLRELAAGIHPALLSDEGLLAAVTDRAGRMPIPVTVEATDAARSARLAEAIEVAAYFAVCEALANVLKHAGAPSALVRLDIADGELRIAVRDTGAGFETRPVTGTGLAQLTDRLAAVGGELAVESEPGHGTGVRVVLPAAPREPSRA